MTDLRPTEEQTARTDGDTPRVRPCLKCKTEFKSGWVGERICPRCKSSKGWRGGAVRSYSSGLHR